MEERFNQVTKLSSTARRLGHLRHLLCERVSGSPGWPLTYYVLRLALNSRYSSLPLSSAVIAYETP